MQITDKSLPVWEEFFRLLGQAMNTPSQSADIELGRFVVAQHERFVEMVESLPGTTGQHRKLSQYEDKYINGTPPESA